MLRLLLDEHLSPRLAARLADRRPDIPVCAIQTWDGGTHLQAPDDAILAAAHEQGLTLVTYDQRTIPPLLRAWAKQDHPHGGVIFVDEHTLAPDDFGGLVRALERLWDAQGHLDWTDRVIYLRRAR